MPSEFIKEKSREISYALIRVAFYIKRMELRDRMENLAFELLDNAARVSVENNNRNIISALSTIASLDILIRLAHSIYEVEPVNATILVRELNNLNSAIRQFGKSDEQLPNLESLFSHNAINNPVASAINFGGQFNTEENLVSSGNENLDAYKSEVAESETSASVTASTAVAESNSPARLSASSFSGSKLVQDNNQALNIAMRQASIVDKIKSANGAGKRLKDVLAEFQDVSERTIRYDLQKLCERGVIERVGNGGPATFYRIVSGQ